jgi:phosphopantetheinyl transferase
MNTLNSIRDCLKFNTVSADKQALPEAGIPALITRGILHIWSAWYSDLDRYYPILSGLISSEEAFKAAGFKKPGDKQKFILRHGMTRAVLGEYIQRDPRMVRLAGEGNGKPNLCPEGNVHDIRFSLSRTDEMACLGISREFSIGVDIVKNDPFYPFLATAGYLFTPGEREWIEQTTPHEQHIRFFRIWSLKEALLKATGSDVGIMKNTDVSGIMTKHFLDGLYPVSVRKKELLFFIHESVCGRGHHCTLATLPVTDTGLQN